MQRKCIAIIDCNICIKQTTEESCMDNKINKTCIFYGAQSGNLWVNYRWEKGIWGSYLKSASEGEAIKMKVEGQTIYWEGEK